MPRVWIPHDMQLVTFDRTLQLKAGWQTVPDELMKHWWLQTNGGGAEPRPL